MSSPKLHSAPLIKGFNAWVRTDPSATANPSAQASCLTAAVSAHSGNVSAARCQFTTQGKQTGNTEYEDTALH